MHTFSKKVNFLRYNSKHTRISKRSIFWCSVVSFICHCEVQEELGIKTNVYLYYLNISTVGTDFLQDILYVTQFMVLKSKYILYFRRTCIYTPWFVFQQVVTFLVFLWRCVIPRNLCLRIPQNHVTQYITWLFNSCAVQCFGVWISKWHHRIIVNL